MEQALNDVLKEIRIGKFISNPCSGVTKVFFTKYRENIDSNQQEYRRTRGE